MKVTKERVMELFLKQFQLEDILVVKRLINVNFRMNTIVKFGIEEQLLYVEKNDGEIIDLINDWGGPFLPERFRKATDREKLLYYTQGSDVLISNGGMTIISEKLGIMRDNTEEELGE